MLLEWTAVHAEIELSFYSDMIILHNKCLNRIINTHTTNFIFIFLVLSCDLSFFGLKSIYFLQ